MIPEKTKETLEYLAREYPDNVKKKLEKGDQVKLAHGFFYEIDNPEIYKQISPENRDGSIKYSKMHDAFKDGAPLIAFIDEGKVRDEDLILPYSRAVETKLGKCLETAVMVHLASQTRRDSFLISGTLAVEEDGIRPTENHAFNIIFKEDKPYLIDARNPWEKREGKVTNPCIIPIEGIDKNGTVIVPEQYRCGREYCVF